MANTNPIATMTDSQLRTAARNYRDGMLEGGDGYNPYQEQLDDRYAAHEAARPKSSFEVRDSLLRQLEVLDCSMARECGTYDQVKVDAIHAQIDALDAEAEAEFAATWTREETQRRRESWNARVKAGEFGRPGSGKTDFVALNKAQVAQGWNVEDLKRAVKLHSL